MFNASSRLGDFAGGTLSPRLAPFLICLLLPLPGFAQSGAPSEAHLGNVQDEPQSELIPHQVLVKQESSSMGLRIPLEVLGGALGGAMGALPGLALATNGFCLSTCTGGTVEQGLMGVLLASAGLVGGTALGIVGGASLVDGQGEYWPTVEGTVLGGLGGGLVGLMISFIAGSGGLVPLAAGLLFGGIIAYENSYASVLSAPPGATASSPRVIPVLAVLPGGGLSGGLSGRF